MSSTSRRQKGIALVFVAIGMLALVAMAGLAIDTGRLVTNKSRLQSVVDSAALAAAKEINTTGSADRARTAAQTVFVANENAFRELRAASLTPTVEFSSTLNPFVAGSLPARYARVAVDGLDVGASLLRVVGVATLDTSASAVAGPQPFPMAAPGTVACDLAPVMVCGDPARADLGYQTGVLTRLKIDAGTQPEVGPGNFQLIRLGGNGGAVVRENMAGAYSGCLTVGNTMETQTGNVVGPVAQGLNTRFDQYSGGGMNRTTYPPDVTAQTPSPELTEPANCRTNCPITWRGQTVTTSSTINFNHGTYSQVLQGGSYPIPAGVPGRRRISVPIGDCSATVNGQGTVPVLGIGCFFLLQPVEQRGNAAYMYGEFVQGCETSGNPSPPPVGGGGGPSNNYRIVLYKNPGSTDS